MKKKLNEWRGYNAFIKFLLVMKLTILIIFVSLVSVSASTYSQSTKLTVDAKDASIVEIFEDIEVQSEFVFIYQNETVDIKNKYNIDFKNSTVEEILEILFKDSGITYEINDRQIIITPKDSIPAKKSESDSGKGEKKENVDQQKKLTGTVAAKDGEPIPGVTVFIKGTSKGTVTDIDGNFSLNGVAEGNIVQFSFVGMVPQEITFTGQTQVNITLEEETLGLEEVVVVGYGLQKKETVTGAISTIDTEELLQSPQANVSNALVGRMPGLQAVQRSGEPGEDQSILRIRGIGTFTGSADPLIMVDGIEAQNYNNIDPNEIESITILKDASATAVYGVRGANGVLLITTKRGKEGKPKITINSNFAISRFTELRESLNSYDYARLYNEALKYDSYITGGYTPRFSEEEIAKYKSGEDPVLFPSTDWQDMVLKPTASQMHHNLMISGGTPKVKYFVSAGMFSQEGLFKTKQVKDIFEFDPQIKFQRYNFRSNFDFNITEYFSATVNLSSQIEQRKGFNQDTRKTMEFIMRANPLDSPGLYDNKLVVMTGADPSTSNPLYWMGANGYRENYRNYLNGSVRFNYDFEKLLPGLKTHVTFSYQNYNEQNSTYRKTLLLYNAKKLESGDYALIPNGIESPFYYQELLGNGKEYSRRYYLEAGVDYAKTFNDTHEVTGMLLYKQSKYYDPTLAFLVSNGYQGFAGRLTYNYKKRYLAEFNIGYEGTENFAEGNRFGFFPAGSLGWVISEENFFPENDIVSYLKVRGTIGQVGNDRIGDISSTASRFLYRPSSYTYSGGYHWGEVGSTYNYYYGSAEGKIGNPDLTWEKSTKKNLGLELHVLDNKIQFSMDWFSEVRDNILANKGTVPAISGAELPAYNLGKMKNSGIEADITFRSTVGKLNYWVRGNYTYAHNVIEFMDEVNRTNPYQYRTGLRYGQFFGFLADGLYNTWEEVNDPNRPVVMWQNNKLQPGDIKYVDINSDGFIDNDDIVPIGYSNFPEKVFGFSFGGDIKGVDFSVLFQGASNVSMNTSRRTNRGFFQNSGASKLLLQSWSQERYENGESILLPHLSVDGQDNNYQNSSFWIRDASYLRLKNIEIGYTFSSKLIQKLSMSSCRVYINGSNLYTWDNLFPGEDPEFPNSETDYEPYPVTSTFNVGLNLKF